MATFFVDDIVVSEGDGFVDIVVRLDAPASGPLSVNYATTAGTAAANYDYTAVSGTLNFVDGQQFATVRVNLLQSGTYDSGALENFRFNLSAPTGGATLGQASAMVSIVDNDNPVPVGLPTLFVRDVVVDEKAGTATFVVLLGGVDGQATNNVVTVDYATQNGGAASGSDYGGVAGTLSFAVGETVKRVTVNITDDATAEGLERFYLNLSNATNATIVDGRGVAAIGSSDQAPAGSPALSVADMVVGEGDGYIDVVVTLSAPSTVPVSVAYATAASTAAANYDFIAASGTLNFAVGETSKVVRIELGESATYDSGALESFRFNLSAPTGGATLGKASAMVSVVDNDNPVPVGLPTLFVRDVVVDEKAGTATFAVLLGGVDGQGTNNVVTVEYGVQAGTAAAGSDYVAGSEPLSGTLTFGVGETVKTVTVDITDDATAEGLERFYLNLSNATNATIVDGRGVAAIGSSDQAAVGSPALSVADMVVGEGDGYIDVVVALSAPSTGPVSVAYATAASTAAANYDFIAVSGTLNFAVGETTKVVRIELGESATYDSGVLESFRFNLSAPTGGATLGKGSAMVSVVDNDNAVPVGLPTLTVRDVVVDEKAGTATFVVLLGGVSGQVSNSIVTVDYAAGGGTATAGADCLAGSEPLSGTLTFGVGETVKTVTLSLVDDALAEGSERLDFLLSNASNATITDGRAVAVIGDSDAANVGLPTITVADKTVSESDGYVDLVLKLSGPSSSAVSVNYATAPGSAAANYDYIAVSGTANFAAGETTKVVRIELAGSATYDTAGTTEGFVLNLSAAVNATIGNSSANVSIIDDDAGINVQSFGISDDVYTLLLASDLVVENPNGGLDLVQSAFTHALQANVENLTLTGSDTIDGSGNGLDNLIIGNSAANTLTGQAGNDTLDGAGGSDTMNGGAGNDTFVVASAGDVVVEAAAQGTDLVRASISYTLGNDVENLTLTGAGALNGTGNALGNVLTGNTSANLLDGRGGADTMAGGAGNDIYVVDVVGDVITEAVGEGIDLVRSAVTYTLGANVERLTLTGVGSTSGTGNALSNAMTGNTGANRFDAGGGNDTLNGGGGNDTLGGGAGNDLMIGGNGNDRLTGGAGVDAFQFNSTIGSDVITDFVSGADALRFSMAALPVGDGDLQVEGAVTVAGAGGFAASAEMVIVTTDIVGTITVDTAAAAIGSANSAYVAGQKVLFAVDNGTDTAVYLFTSAAADAQVGAAELVLLGQLAGTVATATTDFVFVA